MNDHLGAFRQAQIKFRVSPAQSIEGIMLCLLKEGHTTKELQQILDTPDRAYFTLASYPQYPIVLTLSSQADYMSLTIQSESSTAVLMVECTVLSRLLDLLVNSEHPSGL